MRWFNYWLPLQITTSATNEKAPTVSTVEAASTRGSLDYDADVPAGSSEQTVKSKVRRKKVSLWQAAGSTFHLGPVHPLCTKCSSPLDISTFLPLCLLVQIVPSYRVMPSHHHPSASCYIPFLPSNCYDDPSDIHRMVHSFRSIFYVILYFYIKCPCCAFQLFYMTYLI